ncbi:MULTISPECIES: NupC/NupG family nucleoside CNT transporter [unclassified Novosphingobium]|uniref:NupC/NupG family nucleoside CNT transporter n=1 Tax=unclassified Novosphingobium TaxID=2644732 RepID=UPI0014427FB3|nr:MULTISPECIES: NupC/NupG family nucleoside CNT transporter [unclassified Novosphingobium]MBB3359293.1 CNT family concentrative nucleoside transporter [Novosphingobium sp. BK256]MBB3375227.1 CNT family concentrative nucleoside transporter [Novosphingobium sp. BK280]MBB3380065.1 CNT family concentrative nucleoside transporter [Novosphingobium sp. BK258]MBB3421760.1 CNT family concentrative nucleoside transporter [Novosphingobium sp. BK267]MBB3450075.1 CNT family concentrative nucleoside transp
MRILSSLGGMALLFAIAFLLSSNRRAIRWRVVLPAFALQAGLAALVLSFPPGKAALQGAAHAVEQLLSYSRAGVEFVFGNLASAELGGKSVAIAVLPPIVFFAALISILYYLGIMPLVIRWIGGALEKVTGISRVESLCAAANIFVGQSESPLVIRPYLAALTPSQVFTVMSVGMAGVAGTILAAYAGLGVRVDYLVAAAFMSAPGGVFMGKLIMPDVPPLHDAVDADADAALTNPHIKPSLEEAPEEQRPANLIMAAAQGAQTGVKLAVAVGAMLLAFVALIALANGMLGWAGGFFGHPGLTFQQILAPIFAPVFLLLGAPNWAEAMQAGGLFGTKIVLNEFVGFIDLQEAKGLSDHTIAIVTFALCGFANFSSIAIQMAVTGGLAPNQRPVIARLGIKALCAGALSNLMSAALAGLFLSL